MGKTSSTVSLRTTGSVEKTGVIFGTIFPALATGIFGPEAFELSSNPVQRSEEYLTIEELSDRLKLEPKTIRNKMASGVFRKGIHYFSPQGLRPRFKWSAVVAWLEEKDAPLGEVAADAIPMARGYLLGERQRKKLAVGS